MRRRILITLISVSFLFSFASSTSATPLVTPPACVTTTLDQYLLLGPAGCSIGDEIAYTDFSFTVVSSAGGAIPVAAANILMTPLAGDFVTSLAFSSAGFSVTGLESVTYRIGYTIDPHPILSGFEEFMDASSPVFPGTATVTTNLCIGAAFTGINCLGPGVADSTQVFHNGTTTQLSDSTFFAPTAILGVLHTIALAANGASADFNGVSTSTLLTPEPATWLLIGSGLGAGLLRRHRKKSL